MVQDQESQVFAMGREEKNCLIVNAAENLFQAGIHAPQHVRKPCLKELRLRCEIVEVRNLVDADGIPCSRTASKQCSDCGSELCETHPETCEMCHEVFCPSCMSFHEAEHPKPIRAEHERDRERRIA